MSKQKTHEQFVIDANIVHNNKFTYPDEYKGNKTKIMITCPIHGDFPQIPNNHLGGTGCPYCGTENMKLKQTKTHDSFVNEANIIHLNKYEYPDKYVSSFILINIYCKQHDYLFLQTPHDHLNNHGCPKCANKYKPTTIEFNEKANIVHNNKYTYPEEYKGSKIKIMINCVIHGNFPQIPNIHLNGAGCPTCNSSKGEIMIEKKLLNNDIIFEKQKKFKDCIYKNKLKFDFYLPNINTCIEYDGIQHFQIIKYFGGENEFNNIQNRDNIKTNYCKDNNINLIRIRYDEDIEQKLKENNII
jgi:hypothetical protein